MSRLIDIDAARAAKAETEAEPVEVRVDGVTYTLPAKLPASVVFAFGEVADGKLGALRRAFVDLLGDRADDVLAGLDWDECQDLLSRLMGEYGMGDLPEASGSARQPARTGTR